MQPHEHTTRLLRRLEAGDASVGEELLPRVYQELYDLAHGYMAGERAAHTLQPTALVHEAWIRLTRDETPEWADRAHFIAIAARAMRRVLIDHARRRGAVKRGEGERPEPLDAIVELYEERALDLMALDEALQGLASIDEELAQVVELRFFGGASHAEVARALGVSERTIERRWQTAQAWLRGALGEVGN